MKCIVLAGGSGNRLWPLSRNNYPKQFINIKDNHSLLQETIVRNLPYCDEFVIVTNEKYNFIVESQMRVFQGLKYRCIYEELPRKTAPAITLAAMLFNPSEMLLIVTADHLISGSDYQRCIIKGRQMAKSGELVLFGLPASSAHTGYGYIMHSGSVMLDFHEKPSECDAKRYVDLGKYLWNSGIYMFTVGDYLNELKKKSPVIYESCKLTMKKAKGKGHEIDLPAKLLKNIPAYNIEPVLLEKMPNARVIEAGFKWVDVSELESLIENTNLKDSENIIKNACSNTEIINTTEDRLVVANEIDDSIIVNTDDAIYISKQGSAFQIKSIIEDNYDKYERFFEDNVLSYRSWGTYEVLKNTKNYRVKKVTVYPEESLGLHKHLHRSEHWSIVQGRAQITLNNEVGDYVAGDSIDVSKGILHQVSNNSEDNLVIIEIAIGETVEETDTISYPNGKYSIETKKEIIKLAPAFKDYLWGGTKLRERFNKKCEYDIIAESWELSAHPDGESVVNSGKYTNILFTDYLEKIDRLSLGWKCQLMNAFPILIKFIDAKSQLSVQVHPDDDYALIYEQEYGKNEMWYIMDCEENAALYYGFSRDVTKEEVKESIEDDTLLKLLNKVPVKKGDVFFVNAGTVHAIGAGVMVCEIQQSSNSTYRLYDYGRRDKYGNLRELHVEKALAVINTNHTDPESIQKSAIDYHEGYSIEELGKCKYFECSKYVISGKAIINIDDSSFASIIVLEGDGIISNTSNAQTLKFSLGDSFFIPAGSGEISISGETVIILTNI